MISIYKKTYSNSFRNFIIKLNIFSWLITIFGGIIYFNYANYNNITITIVGGIWVVLHLLKGLRPLQEDLDWTLIYPELAGIDGDMAAEKIEIIAQREAIAEQITELKNEISLLK